MLTRQKLEQFTRSGQTTFDNVVREYCQQLFLSYLYQEPGSEKLLFKGGTALRIVFGSPRFSEDLDFTGVNTTVKKVEKLFVDTLAAMENTGIKVEINESKATSGGYLGLAYFSIYNIQFPIQLEVSLRRAKVTTGDRALIVNNYIPAYTLVHLKTADLIAEKLQALFFREKPRDFYDFYYLLSGNYPIVKEKMNLKKVLELINKKNLNYKTELKKFLPASQATQLKDFKKILKQKILSYL